MRPVRAAGDRMVVGWSTIEHATTELAVDAVNLAVARRQPRVIVIHHSVRGSRSTSLRVTEHRRLSDLVGSMGRVGSPADDAMMETFLATVQHELLDTKRWRDRDELLSALFVHLEITHNRTRRRSGLNHLTPSEFNTEARAKLANVH
jgi:putative transposase